MEKNGIEAISSVEIQLPEEIIHHIHSFLNEEESCQTTILSRSWYTAWLTRPNLDLSECLFRSPTVFVEYAKKTMQRYEELNRKIESLRLMMTSHYNWGSDSVAEELISKAMELGATDLHIHKFFELPGAVFQCEALVRLSLHGCIIDLRDQKVCCSRLKSLSLQLVWVVGGTFWDIVSACPLIEELILHQRELDVDLMLVSRPGSGAYGFHKLKVLSLDNMKIGEWLSCDISSRFPCLKELSLINCSYEEMQICSNSLECISLIRTSGNGSDFDKFDFEVPKIRKFIFSGDYVPYLSFKTTPPESDITFTLGSPHLKASCFLQLRAFLHDLTPSNISLHLIIYDYWTCDYHILEKSASPILVENLTIEVHTYSSLCDGLLDDLFRCCRPSFVNIYLQCLNYDDEESSTHTEDICKTLIEEAGEKRNTSALCDLEEVDVKFYEEDYFKKWCRPLPYKTLSEVVLPEHDEIRVKVCLQLKWGGSH